MKTYKEIYKEWCDSPLLGGGEKSELFSIEDNEKEKEYRFGKDLEFGTAGMRGIVGMGTNMMNVYTVRRATQGLADYIKSLGKTAALRGVVISYDTRHMSYEFAYAAAVVLVSNGIKAYLFRTKYFFGDLRFDFNYDEGNFKYYKLDFADFRNYAQMENMIRKIRTFEQYAGHTAKVNWDVTESAARFGYFWAKEYGAVFLENRRHDKPLNVIYEPYLVLRDLWHLSKYCNLNKFQGTIQNKETVSADLSDAYRYSHAYTVGIALMSTPLFFQETKFYSNKALSEIKTVIDAYKPIRHSLYDCYVFPVGEEPDNASWSGFQAISPDGNSGFMTVFREINNNNPSYNMAIYNNGSKKMKIKDLISGKTEIIDISKANEITVFIPKPGEFRFLSYEYVN